MSLIALDHDRIDIESDVEDGEQDGRGTGPSSRETHADSSEDNERKKMGNFRHFGPLLESCERSRKTAGTIKAGSQPIRFA